MFALPVQNNYAPHMRMDEILSDFVELKVSALSKAKYLSEFIVNVPLETNTTVNKAVSVKCESIENNHITDKSRCRTVPSNDVEMEDTYQKVLAKLDRQRRHDVQQAINKKTQEIKKMDRLLAIQRKEEWSRKQQNILMRMQEQEVLIHKKLEQHEKDSSESRGKLLLIYQELAERRNLMIKAREERYIQIKIIIDEVFKAQDETAKIYLEILQHLKDCDEIIKEQLKDCIKNLTMIPGQIDEIVNKCKSTKVNNEDAIKCGELLQLAGLYRNEIVSKITEYNNRKAELTKKEEQSIQIQAKPETVVKPAQEAFTAADLNVLDSFVSKKAFKIYSDHQLFQQAQEDIYKPLIDDASLKLFKFDCKKAVNIPVNALSARADHLLDKFNKLHNLMAGKTVRIGDAQITASTHPQGVPFCMDLLAKKFVLQGDLMISSNPEAAFYYSSIIVNLWNDFPNFGKLLIARFHQSCPYLVPLYIPRTVGQNDEEYYTNLGYQYKDGVVEKQDKFLKRMTGIFRLYFAILITKPRRGENKGLHDLSNAWTWLTNVLNLDPRTDITATALLVFLEVIGWAMDKSYGKQFKKLVFYIMTGYMEKMRLEDSGGPVARLELLLQNYCKNGYFDKPKGILPANFW